MGRRHEREPQILPHKRPVKEPSTAAAIERERSPLKKAGKILGPGFITGASDDDPSGIGTYAIAGASFGLSLLWTALLTYPLMAAVQDICARVGMISGEGLAGVLRRHYPRPLLYGAVTLLFVANVINIGADLRAVADAVHLLTGVAALWLVVPVAGALVALQIVGSYRLIANTFKWLTLALLAYVADAVIVRPELGETLRATVIPTFSFDPSYFAALIAIFGTTISPYLFFWQSAEEVEEEVEIGRTTRAARRGASRSELRYKAMDVAVGMAFSNGVMYFIILATGLTLARSGKTDINSAADAAEALRPIAGDLAGALFAIGMIGAGLLAVPILSGSAAYALAEALGWRYGLDAPWHRAKSFYAVIVGATALGVALDFSGVNPIDALFWTAVVNGAVAPPLLVLVMLAARNSKVMGRQVVRGWLALLGWVATAAMFVALSAFLVVTIFR